jgi:ParB family chromosome partitioning protein
MRIALKDIKGLDRRVRQQMSPEKLEELTDSIKDLGLIVPIKVRKNGDGYVLIYGHRRVQAAKAAGLTEIEAIVENVPDDALLTQSLAENVIREDMAAIDIAKALRLILDETGATQEALAKKMGWSSHKSVGQYLDMLDPELGIQKTNGIRIPLGKEHVVQSKAGTGGDIKLAGQVLKKAADEELSTRDTRKVAEVVRQANEFGGAAAVKRVLAQPAARIIDTAAYLPARPKAKAAALAPSKSLFQWIKDPQIMLAEDGIGAARTVVAMIANGDRDPSGGKVALRKLGKMVDQLSSEIDKALERLS